jgi:hypothetical protein
MFKKQNPDSINIITKPQPGNLSKVPGLDTLKGSNNGTWGFGMLGILMPPELNGPLGFQNNPVPYKLPLSDGPSPAYNDTTINAPAYNAPYFASISGQRFEGSGQ